MFETATDQRTLLGHVARRLVDFGAPAEKCGRLFEGLACDPQVYGRGVDLARRAGQTPEIVVAGWACTMRPQSGRTRQIFGLILPGDVLGSFGRSPEFTFWGVTALTPVAAVPATPILAIDGGGAPLHPEILKAAQRAEDYAHHLLVDHLVRLGGRDAYAGLAHLLLELHLRLKRVGLARGGVFELPIGQRVLAQVMGFSVAHTNQTLQRMTADGLFSIAGRTVRLLQLDRMSAVAEFTAREPELLVWNGSAMDGLDHQPQVHHHD